LLIIEFVTTLIIIIPLTTSMMLSLFEGESVNHCLCCFLEWNFI